MCARNCPPPACLPVTLPAVAVLKATSMHLRAQHCANTARVTPLSSAWPAVTPGHYLFAWRGAGAAAAAEAALPRPAAWPYVLPGQLAPGDVVPVAAADWSGDRRLVLARVTAVEREEGEGVYMPHTLTGALPSRGRGGKAGVLPIPGSTRRCGCGGTYPPPLAGCACNMCPPRFPASALVCVPQARSLWMVWPLAS